MRAFAVETRPGKGRCAIAACDLEAGTVLLEETPVISAPLLFRGDLAPPMRFAHSDRVLSAEKAVRGRVARIAAEFDVDAPMLLAVLRLSLLWQIDGTGQPEEAESAELASSTAEIDPVFTSSVRDAASLVLQYEAVTDKWTDSITRAISALCEALRSSGDSLCRRATSEEEMKKWALRLNANTHAIRLGGKVVGVGMFPHAAMFNHACFPNCEFVADGEAGVLRVRTVRAGPAGTELSFAYTTLHAPSERRREAIQRSRGFLCQCERCEDAEGRWAPVEALFDQVLCAECSVPLQQQSGASVLACSGSCGRTFDADVPGALVGHLTATAQRVERAVRTQGFKRALLGANVVRRALVTMVAGEGRRDEILLPACLGANHAAVHEARAVLVRLGQATELDVRRMIATVRLSRGDTPCQDEAELWRELLALGAAPSAAEQRRIAAVDAVLPHHVDPAAHSVK